MRLLAARTAARCALCHDGLGPGAHACPGCAAVLHATCWGGAGCPTLGCAGEPRARGPARSSRRVRPGLLFAASLTLIGAAVWLGGWPLAATAWLAWHRADYERLAAGVRDGALRPIPWVGSEASWYQVAGTRARRVACGCGVFVEIPLPRAWDDARRSLVHGPVDAPCDHLGRGAWRALGDGWWLLER